MRPNCVAGWSEQRIAREETEVAGWAASTLLDARCVGGVDRPRPELRKEPSWVEGRREGDEGRRDCGCGRRDCSRGHHFQRGWNSDNKQRRGQTWCGARETAAGRGRAGSPRGTDRQTDRCGGPGGGMEARRSFSDGSSGVEEEGNGAARAGVCCRW
jgi:hypothetical protein